MWAAQEYKFHFVYYICALIVWISLVGVRTTAQLLIEDQQPESQIVLYDKIRVNLMYCGACAGLKEHSSLSSSSLLSVAVENGSSFKALNFV